jgi:2-polyprenyl-6-hydroxyphenyl methylase/3-demethylubiquinone-9 3-methyltransferase
MGGKNKAPNVMTDTYSNVDPNEVAKFNALANGWWDQEGESKPLHQINPVRLAYIKAQSQGLANKQAIDVGCGGGILSEALAKEGAFTTGIDMGKMALDIATLHALESELSIDYQHITAEDMATKAAGQYDVVTCMEMLEHVPDPLSVIKACAELARPGADLFFSTLNRHPKAYLIAILGAEYIKKMLPKGTHDYKRFIKPSELAAWCRQADLEVMNITGINYNVFTQDFALGEDVKVNYVMHCKKAIY